MLSGSNARNKDLTQELAEVRRDTVVNCSSQKAKLNLIFN